jgi:Fic family protein
VIAKNRKMAVLHQLSQELEPITIHELLEKLDHSFIERTVRRWLAEMINEGIVEKIGHKRSTKYFISQKTNRNKGMTSSCFSKESLDVVAQVKRPLYERMPVAYNDLWLDSYVPNTNFYIPIENRIELQKAGKRLSREEPAGTYAHQIFNRLLIDLSYNSSRLEGNTYSLLDTKRLILEGAGAEGKLEEEKIMILNHKEAIRSLIDNAAKLEVTEQTIFTLHFLLSDGLVEARFAGKVRDYSVTIGGSTYRPFADKRQLQIRFKRIIEKAAMIEDPFEQSLFLLAHLSYIQYFADVNKRTAMLSSNISLIKNNLVPLSFNDVTRDDYTSAMIAIYELQKIQPLVDLYLFSYMRTCAMYDATVKELGFDEIRVRYRQQRRGLIRDIIINKLTGEPMKKYISQQIPLIVKEVDREAFFGDIMEDLNEIDQSRIVGLGITLDELDEWKKLTND